MVLLLVSYNNPKFELYIWQNMYHYAYINQILYLLY